MTDQSELNSRAALCRKLAQREPANRIFWIAEAENWSRLSKQKRRGEDGIKIASGILVRLRTQSAKFLAIHGVANVARKPSRESAQPGYLDQSSAG